MLALKRMRLLPKDQDWTGYVWLVYLAFFLAVPFVFDVPAWQRLATVLGTLAALPLYFWGYWLCDRRVLWVVGGFTVLGSLFATFNPGACTLFIFAATYLARMGDPGLAFRYLAALLALEGLEAWIMRYPPSFWIPTIGFSALIGSVTIHWVYRHRLADKLLAAQAENEHLAKVAERERIARDLHDLLGHTLSVIILKSELASRLTSTDPARAAGEIRDVEQISREALSQVRAAVRGYRSAGFDSELREALRALEAAGIQVETSVEQPRLSPAQETVFAMALREAVTNVLRHAQATVCRLTMRQSGRYCEMEIRDNGRGGALAEGSGLSGMRERVEALGGALERDGSHGTLLRIRVPV
ncbi:MAG TPA: sensor histidine kinase [Bryobacteraceae bacterium]|nr:sensor histidine kinase [Bryobacteraceae bacterium]